MSDNMKISRREIVKKVVTVSIAIGAFAKIRARADAAPTVEKSTAAYVPHPVFGNECSWCVHFVKPNACEIVEGAISPHGHCKYYKPAVP
jgi:hypothetical protein